MKKATTPMTATPPATDKPMIEPVPRPESEEGGLASGVAVELGGTELVRVTTTSELIVIRPRVDETTSGLVVCDGGEDEGGVVDDGREVSEEAELTVLDAELRLVLMLLGVVVGVEATEVGCGSIISLWAATKYEKRRERKTDDHFIFVGEDREETTAQCNMVTWSHGHMVTRTASSSSPPPLFCVERFVGPPHVYRMSLSLRVAPLTDC